MFLFIKDILIVAVYIFTASLLAFFFHAPQLHSQELPRIDLPEQSPPPRLETTQTSIPASNIGPNTNLVILLDKIRNLSSDGRLAEAQKVATTALENLNESEQNEFYLRQIKAEETKLYFKLANQAMLQKQYSQASQYIERYRENVAEELENRKLKREIKTELGERKDVSLVGRLVEELDQAKKDLAQLRAKSGLPKDDAQPDLDRLVEEEKGKLDRSLMNAENLLRKARFDSSQGRYELADQYLNEALSSLTPNSGTIAIISDLYKAKQQVIWYRVGEAMLKGKVAEVQELTLNYKEIEESRRKVETQTLGVSAEIDFDAEIKKANEKNREQAKFAKEMLRESKDLIKNKEYDRAEKILLKISNFLEPSTLTWPIILEASLIKNRIYLSKADDARKDKDWVKAKELLDEFRTGFYSDRNIQGDTLTYGRPGLKETEGEDAVEKELGLAEKELEKIQKDKSDPFKRDITEFTPEWKEQQEILRELLMRAKVQFINGDLTGATETYRVVETRYSDNFEAKEMLKRISQMRQQESYLGYIKTRQEMLEEIEREWERPKVFDRQIEETKEVEEGPSNIEEKLKLIEIPGVDFFNSPLSEAMTELQRQARLFDLTEPDPAKKGLNIIPLIGEEEEPTVNIKLNAMPLGKMIEFITEMVGWTFDIRSDAIVIQKTGGTFKGRPLETEFYDVEPPTLKRLTGNMGGGGDDADPFAPAGGGNDGAADDGIKIKTFLENTGIPFIDAQGHKFAFDGFQLSVTHERRYLDLIERVLAKIDESSGKQVEIEAKFLEVQEGALDEISFDWQYSWGNSQMLMDDQFRPVVDNRGRFIRSYEKVVTGNTRNLASAHSPSGLSRDIVVNVPDNPDAGMVLPNPLPNLPGKIGIGAGVSPLTNFSVSREGQPADGNGMIIGSSQAALMISALKRKQGTDLLSAPRVTVMNGVEAKITVAQEFIYPIEYDVVVPEPPGPGGVLGGDGGGGTVLPAVKAIFEEVAPEDGRRGFREVGVVLKVTPTVEKYNSINLKLEPNVTEFDGFIEYGGSNTVIGGSGGGPPSTIITPSGQIMPIFSVRKVQTEVSIFDGATVIIGGLTREEVKTVNDKIPVLGNIPLIGKLFQSNAESYQKRNLLIFVTASVVSKGGSPVREVIQNISPQSIFKDPVIMTPTGTIRRTFKEDDEEAK
jgi:general secretion pathway protein D